MDGFISRLDQKTEARDKHRVTQKGTLAANTHSNNHPQLKFRTSDNSHGSKLKN